MVKVVWTELSIDDLKEIFDYISKNSAHYARITVDRIYSRANQITINPRSGRIVPEFGSDLVRELIIGNYRLIYYIVDENRVDIIRVYHSARSLKEDDLK